MNEGRPPKDPRGSSAGGPAGLGDRTRGVRSRPSGRTVAVAAVAVLLLAVLFVWPGPFRPGRSNSVATPAPAPALEATSAPALATAAPTAAAQIAAGTVIDVSSGQTLEVTGAAITFRYSGQIYTAEFIGGKLWAKPLSDSGFKMVEGSELLGIAAIERGAERAVLTFH